MLVIFQTAFQLLKRAFNYWLIPFVTTITFVVLALVYLQVRTVEYDVYMVIAPVPPPGGARTPSFDVGSAASLLGIRAGGTGDAFIDQYQELLTSVELTRRFDPKSSFFQGYFSGEWDAATNSWRPPQGKMAQIRRSISEALGAPPWQPPNAARFASEMENELSFSAVGRSEMLRVSIRATNPNFAVRLLNTLNQTADSILRTKGRERVVGYLAYLNRELPNVRNTENQKALADLVLEQQRQLMALNALGISYATQMIEAPSLPYLPVSMRPLRLLAMAVMMGLATGLALIYLLPDAPLDRLLRRNRRTV